MSVLQVNWNHSKDKNWIKQRTATVISVWALKQRPAFLHISVSTAFYSWQMHHSIHNWSLLTTAYANWIPEPAGRANSGRNTVGAKPREQTRGLVGPDVYAALMRVTSVLGPGTALSPPTHTWDMKGPPWEGTLMSESWHRRHWSWYAPQMVSPWQSYLKRF